MTNDNTATNEIMRTTMNRLPLYYNFLLNKRQEGVAVISSSVVAKSLKLNNIQVRKDLASVSSVHGKPKVGFEVDTLINDIERVLGFHQVDEMVLVGVGRLGRTLLNYGGFNKFSMNIVAGFDNNVEKIGTFVNKKPVMSLDGLESFVRERNIKIGIITVNGQSAQSVCDILVKAGIEAIWNFAPVHLEIPDGIMIKHENLAASLALLVQRYENSKIKNLREEK